MLKKRIQIAMIEYNQIKVSFSTVFFTGYQTTYSNSNKLETATLFDLPSWISAYSFFMRSSSLSCPIGLQQGLGQDQTTSAQCQSSSSNFQGISSPMMYLSTCFITFSETSSNLPSILSTYCQRYFSIIHSNLFILRFISLAECALEASSWDLPVLMASVLCFQYSFNFCLMSIESSFSLRSFCLSSSRFWIWLALLLIFSSSQMNLLCFSSSSYVLSSSRDWYFLKVGIYYLSQSTNADAPCLIRQLITISIFRFLRASSKSYLKTRILSTTISTISWKVYRSKVRAARSLSLAVDIISYLDSQISSRRHLAGVRWTVSMFLVAFQTELAACLNHMLYYKAYDARYNCPDLRIDLGSCKKNHGG